MDDVTPEVAAMAAEIRGEDSSESSVESPSVEKPSSLSSLEEKAAAFEEEWDQKQGSAASEDDNEAAKPKGDPTKPRSSRLQDLVNSKYGGDENAMADAYWEQARSVSALNKRFEEFVAEVRGKGEEKSEFESLVKEDPEAQIIDQELQTNVSESQRLNDRNNKIVSEVYAHDQEIAELRGEIKRADEEDKHVLQALLRNKEATRDALTREFTQNERDKKSLAKEKVTLERQRRNVEKTVKEELETTQRTKAEEKVIIEQQRNILYDSVADQIKKYGLELESAQHAYIHNTIQNQLYVFLSQRDADSDGIDVPQAVEILMRKYAEANNLQPKSLSTIGKQKLDTLTRPAPKGPTPQAKVRDTGREWTPEFAKARAKAILGG